MNFYGLYYLSFLLAYFLTYPTRVFLINPDVSLINIILLTLAPMVLIRQFLLDGPQARIVPKHDLYAFGIMLILLLLYGVNAAYANFSKSITATLIKYLSYSAVFLTFAITAKQIKYKNNAILTSICFSLSLFTFLAIILNSFFWRIPPNAELMDKYFIGPFIRAGGGYLDPNFLSINIIILLFFSLTHVKNNYLRPICVLLLSASVFLTFSRGALIFGFLSLIFYLIIQKKISPLKLLPWALILAGISLLLIWQYDLDFVFSRFSSNEGKSSTDDRLYQYYQFLKLVENQIGIENLFIGFGGLDIFIRDFHVALHSFWLNLILDVGFIAPLLILLLWAMYFIKAKEFYLKALLLFWFAQITFLPNLPDALFMILIMSVVSEHSPKQ